eukprot:GGOE01015481.1.p1 GENE.GGOE01015481.1~~GGOE01015481.1.p1  ORF type:complete len:384 (-),score=63.89 GGOE01015481.1:442-1593(-)
MEEGVVVEAAMAAEEPEGTAGEVDRAPEGPAPSTPPSRSPSVSSSTFLTKEQSAKEVLNEASPPALPFAHLMVVGEKELFNNLLATEQLPNDTVYVADIKGAVDCVEALKAEVAPSVRVLVGGTAASDPLLSEFFQLLGSGPTVFPTLLFFADDATSHSGPPHIVVTSNPETIHTFLTETHQRPLVVESEEKTEPQPEPGPEGDKRGRPAAVVLPGNEADLRTGARWQPVRIVTVSVLAADPRPAVACVLVQNDLTAETSASPCASESGGNSSISIDLSSLPEPVAAVYFVLTTDSPDTDDRPADLPRDLQLTLLAEMGEGPLSLCLPQALPEGRWRTRVAGRIGRTGPDSWCAMNCHSDSSARPTEAARSHLLAHPVQTCVS